MSSSSSPQQEYEIFVSFRGDDVRDNFVSHLCDRLKGEGISYFFDEDREDAGKKIDDKIFSAIRHSTVALIVLSEKYAGSHWCLEELVKILQCNRKPGNLEIIPIFYRVDPAVVKKLPNKSKFGKAFKKLCEEWEDEQQIETWKEALREVKKFSGFQRKKFRTDAELVNEVTHPLYQMIFQVRLLDLLKNAIGADRLANDVISLLNFAQKDVLMIGISGTEGIGKTMVAKAVCKGTLDKFDRFIFLEEVGKAKDYDLVSLQKKLLQNLIKMHVQDDNSHGYTERIKTNLHRKKILLVLDGVTAKEQLKPFGAENRKSFRSGSRILITTRDRDLLKDLKVYDKYIIEGLNQEEAFRLFCRHAFEGEEPKEGYKELSEYLAHYAGGHPLTLKNWGSFLAEKSKDDWQKYSDQLVENPDLFSIGADFEPIFKKYPFTFVGPFGGDRSTDTWKDEGYTDVREIHVGVGSKGIKFIKVQYDRYGCPCNPVTHGTKGGEESKIVLKYPNEYLTSISGYTKKVSGCTIIQSLTFHTNKGGRALIGTNNGGNKFSFPFTGGKIVGFHGSCNGSHLESIGAFYEQIPHTYPVRVFGPFGGAGKKSWDLEECIDISEIIVWYGSFIHSIVFNYVDANGAKKSTSCGGACWGSTFEIKLENANEYITAFSGYFKNASEGRTLISSLTFQTNKRILGPIGTEGGEHFSSPSEAVKVIGFFGRSNNYLENIGARVELYSNKIYPFKSVGLFGSSKESNWDDGNDHTDVRKILVEIEPGDDGKFIRSITFRYEKNGRSCPSERWGGAEGKVAIEIGDSDEYLTSMSGYYMDGGITSLTFGTNKRTLEPIGREEGIYFSSPATGGKIVGFYGRSVENLEAIGAYFEPISRPHQSKSIGPFGGPGGSPWEFDGVREITVMFDQGIRHVGLSSKGKSEKVSDKRGGRTRGGKPEVKTVKLDCPREYLTSISGYIQKREDGDIIHSLSFYTNRRKHGPFGEETGEFFWYPSTGSRIISFYGTNGETLNSIGVRVEPIPCLHHFGTVGPFGGSGGTSWDDGVHTDVRGFRISFGKAIEAIGIAYDNNGSFVSGSEHGNGYDNKGSFVLGLKPGERDDHKYKEVLLDYPKERLLSIKVWVDEDGNTGQTIVHDLKIYTTKRTNTYGPFIEKQWSKRDKLTDFHIPSKTDGDRRIVGFFGRVGAHLNSIGARMEPY